MTIPAKERDRDLSAKLRSELPGILNWAIEGLRAWRSGGLRPPARVLEATIEYREENDLVGPFLAIECFVDQSSKETKVRTGELFGAYAEWCTRNGEQPVTKRTFGTILKERGFTDSIEKSERVKYGIRLLTDEEWQRRNGIEAKFRNPV